MAPSGPVAPVAPSTPVAPVAPSGPVAPVAPGSPVAPVAPPGSPAGPVAPVEPITAPEMLEMFEPSPYRYVATLPICAANIATELMTLAPVMLPPEPEVAMLPATTLPVVLNPPSELNGCVFPDILFPYYPAIKPNSTASKLAQPPPV